MHRGALLEQPLHRRLLRCPKCRTGPVGKPLKASVKGTLPDRIRARCSTERYPGRLNDRRHGWHCGIPIETPHLRPTCPHLLSISIPSHRCCPRRRAASRRHREAPFFRIRPGHGRAGLVQGRKLARHRGRHRCRHFPERSLVGPVAGGGVAVGGNRRRPGRAREPAGLDRRSHRRHPSLRGRPSRLVGLDRPRAEGRPVLGIVHAPVHDRLYEATRGGGALLQRHAPFGIGSRPTPARGGAKAPRSSGSSAHYGSVEHLPKVPSLALRLVRVAEGSIDLGLVSARSADWDIAAADLILREAGAFLSDFSGRPASYNRPQPKHGEMACRWGMVASARH